MKSIITKFFKDVWLKYYNFIQWTKKWHFCHVYAIMEAIYIFIILPLTLVAFSTPIDDEFSGGLIEHIYLSDAFVFCTLLVYAYYHVLTMLLSTAIGFLAMLIKIILGKKISVSNKFLMQNSIYDKIYTTVTSIIIAFILSLIIIIVLKIEFNFD